MSNSNSIMNNVRHQLKDKFSADNENEFTDEELNVLIQEVAIEVSGSSPYRAAEPVITVEDSKIIDISGISNLLKVDKVEYPVGQSPHKFRNYQVIDNDTIEALISSAFSNSGTSGTLTGTVTFTASSAVVTGSGTAFSSELDEDYYIKPSGSSHTRWYRVASVESDTQLTLEEAVKSGDAGADTINITPYKDYVVLVHCRKVHTIDKTSSTMNAAEENCLIKGVVAKAAMNWIGGFRERITRAVTLLSDVNDAIGKMTFGLDKAINDMADARASIGKVTYGNEAAEHMGAALRETQIAATSLGKAQGHQREVQTNLNIGRVIEDYQRWANSKNIEYQSSLRLLSQRNRNVKEVFPEG